jgi:integrase
MGTHGKKKWRKVARTDRFSLFQSIAQPHQFEVSWKKSEGGFGRRRFSAASIDAALEEAPQRAGLVFVLPQDDLGPTVADAFAETLGLTNRNDRSRADWLREQLRFMTWLADHYPECSHWRMINRRMLREYIGEVFTGRSPNRIRLAMQPVIQTGGHMAREYQLPNVAERLGIGTKLVRPPARVFLPDVVSFVDWLRDRGSRLEVAAALQGLAGLAIMEALRLTWDKVDLRRGWIEISGEVKNAHRNRVIPVCSRVVDALSRASAASSSSGVELVRAPVVRSPLGCCYLDGVDSWKNFSREMAAMIRQWNPRVGWTPKDLRNCLPTFALGEGLQDHVWEQYIGHAARSVTERHYVPRLTSGAPGRTRTFNPRLRRPVLYPLSYGRVLNG